MIQTALYNQLAFALDKGWKCGMVRVQVSSLQAKDGVFMVCISKVYIEVNDRGITYGSFTGEKS